MILRLDTLEQPWNCFDIMIEDLRAGIHDNGERFDATL